LNSLALLRLVSRIEADFEIEVRDEDVVISNFRTIGEIAAFIDERRNGPGSP
jgi:acyl carrier protein